MENIQVGAYGWNNASWQGNFYPEDLPEEWQFDFYNNMYRTVLVPQTEWLSWTEEYLEELLEAVEAPFSFFLELDASAVKDPQTLKTVAEKTEFVIAALGDFFAGVVLFDNRQDKDAENEHNFSSVVEAFKSQPLTLVSETLALDGWSWEFNGCRCSGNPCGVISKLTADAKQQAALMQDFEASLPENAKNAAFLIKDSQLAMQQLNNLKVVTELLGF